MTDKNYKKPNSPIYFDFSLIWLFLIFVSHFAYCELPCQFEGSGVKIMAWAPVPRCLYLYFANNLSFVGFPFTFSLLTTWDFVWLRYRLGILLFLNIILCNTNILILQHNKTVITIRYLVVFFYFDNHIHDFCAWYLVLLFAKFEHI